MAWDTTLRWLNLRSTNAYVTDGANQTPLTDDTGLEYPVSVTVGGSSVNVGWTGGSDRARDRDSGVDPRLAGMHFKPNSGTQMDLRIDLPSTGTWKVHLALGDASTAQGYQYLQVLDNSTVRATIDKSSGTLAGEFYDATGTLRTSAANWVSNQQGVELTFASTILIVRLGAPTSQTESSSLAAVGLQKIVTANANLLVGKFGALLKGKLS